MRRLGNSSSEENTGGFGLVLAFFVADGVTLLFFAVDDSCCLLFKDVSCCSLSFVFNSVSVICSNVDGCLVLVWSGIHVR